MLSRITYSIAVCWALLCAGALATPLRSTPVQCTDTAKLLLHRIKNVMDTALEQHSGADALFHGFNCSELHPHMNPGSQTAAVCQPAQEVMCSSASSSLFSEPECLKHITEDLQYYHSRLEAYAKSLDQKQKAQSIASLKLITNSIQTLQEQCPLLLHPQTNPETSWEARDSFDDRMDLCKQLKGFHIRAVTINRALGYISAKK